MARYSQEKYLMSKAPKSNRDKEIIKHEAHGPGATLQLQRHSQRSLNTNQKAKRAGYSVVDLWVLGRLFRFCHQVLSGY